MSLPWKPPWAIIPKRKHLGKGGGTPYSLTLKAHVGLTYDSYLHQPLDCTIFWALHSHIYETGVLNLSHSTFWYSLQNNSDNIYKASQTIDNDLHIRLKKVFAHLRIKVSWWIHVKGSMPAWGRAHGHLWSFFGFCPIEEESWNILFETRTTQNSWVTSMLWLPNLVRWSESKTYETQIIMVWMKWDRFVVDRPSARNGQCEEEDAKVLWTQESKVPGTENRRWQGDETCTGAADLEELVSDCSQSQCGRSLELLEPSHKQHFEEKAGPVFNVGRQGCGVWRQETKFVFASFDIKIRELVTEAFWTWLESIQKTYIEMHEKCNSFDHCYLRRVWRFWRPRHQKMATSMEQIDVAIAPFLVINRHHKYLYSVRMQMSNVSCWVCADTNPFNFSCLFISNSTFSKQFVWHLSNSL